MDWKSALKYIFEKFKLDIKTDTKRIHKSAILLTFLLTTLYIFIASTTMVFNLAIFSKIMLISAFAYEMIFIDLCKSYLDSWVEKLRFKRFVNALKDAAFTLFLFMTFVIVFVIVVLPVQSRGDAVLSLLSGLLLFLLPYAFFDEMLEIFHERFGNRVFKIGGRIIFIFLLLFAFTAVSAQNETNIGNLFDSIQGLVSGMDTISHYIGKFLEFTSSVKDFFSGVGLSSLQSNAVIIVAALIGFYFFLRMLKWVVKWTIVFMVIWVALQVVGII